MPALAEVIRLVILAITVAVFARVILSFIVPFAGANPHPMLVGAYNVVVRITEPLLGPVRRVLPTFGGFDFSPMVVLIVLWVIETRVVAALL